MQSTTLDVIAIQNNPKQIRECLESLKKNPNNILVTNCDSCLKIGTYSIHRMFNAAIYLEESKQLFLLRKTGEMNSKTFQALMDKEQIPYHSVSLLVPFNQTGEEDNEREIWFVNQKDELLLAIEDSKQKGEDTCTYFPKVTSKLNLRQEFDNGDREIFDSCLTKGAIVFPDKVILITKAEGENALYRKPVLRTLEEMNVCAWVDWSREWLYGEEQKQYQKEQF